MRSKIGTALLVVTLSASGNVWAAAFWEGTRLFQRLEKDLNGSTDYGSGAATGYVLGVLDFAQDVLVCMPTGDAGVGVRQAKQIVFNYMQKHPELWNQSADISVVNAVQEVFPCKKK